ncbi:hypothetical protein J6590_088241 [Homalodisca vitripennis]|nr:hypothetical protein J6590_088241 [Homalodisca vitripennis]
MSAYHLRKTEIIYELKIRNFPSGGTAGDLRKRLSQILASNTPIEEAVVNSLDTDTELEECEAKYQDLSALVSDYEGNYNDNEYHRIVARLWHLYLRADRVPVGATADNDHEQTKQCLIICTLASTRSSALSHQPDRLHSRINQIVCTLASTRSSALSHQPDRLHSRINQIVCTLVLTRSSSLSHQPGRLHSRINQIVCTLTTGDYEINCELPFGPSEDSALLP